MKFVQVTTVVIGSRGHLYVAVDSEGTIWWLDPAGDSQWHALPLHPGREKRRVRRRRR